MTLINLPFRPSPGDLEDITQIMADLDAIVAIVNGGLDNSNLASGALIDPSKIVGGLPGTTLITNPVGIPQWAPAGGLPPGSLMPFAGAVTPAGFLLCDGAAISRATYQPLFDAIGTAYGVGDGTNTFNLPNLKGRIIAGLDAAQAEFNTRGKTGGDKNLHQHSHTVNSHSHGGGVAGGYADVGMYGAGAHNHQSYLSYDYIANGALGAAGNNRVTGLQADWNRAVDHEGPTSTVGDHAHGLWQNAHGHGINAEAPGTNNAGTGVGQNLQPYLTVNYLIKT